MSDTSGDDTDVPILRHKTKTNISIGEPLGDSSSKPSSLCVNMDFIKSIGFRYRFILPEGCTKENYQTTWMTAFLKDTYDDKKLKLEKYETSNLHKPITRIYYRPNGETGETSIVEDFDRLNAGMTPKYKINYIEFAPDYVYQINPKSLNYRHQRTWWYENKLKMD